MINIYPGDKIKTDMFGWCPALQVWLAIRVYTKSKKYCQTGIMVTAYNETTDQIQDFDSACFKTSSKYREVHEALVQ